MSQSQQINRPDAALEVAPTPQNTPLDTQVLANRPANAGKPQVEDVAEGEEEDDEEEGANPASLLAKVGSQAMGHGLIAEPGPARARAAQVRPAHRPLVRLHRVAPACGQAKNRRPEGCPG